MFWIGLVVGGFVGAPVGAITMACCAVASRSAEIEFLRNLAYALDGAPRLGDNGAGLDEMQYIQLSDELARSVAQRLREIV